jgi:hypothetical protein
MSGSLSAYVSIQIWFSPRISGGKIVYVSIALIIWFFSVLGALENIFGLVNEVRKRQKKQSSQSEQ